MERSGEKNESAGRQPDFFLRETTRPQIQFWRDLKTILLSTVDYFMVATPTQGKLRNPLGSGGMRVNDTVNGSINKEELGDGIVRTLR